MCLRDEKKGSWLSQIAEDNRKHPTPSENRFMDFLNKYQIPYTFQLPVRCHSGKGYIIDFEIVFAFKKTNKHHHYLHLPIEIDGEYHNTNTQHFKDQTRDEDLLERSHYHKVIHIPNSVTEDEKGLIDYFLREIPNNKIGKEFKKYISSKRKNNSGVTCYASKEENLMVRLQEENIRLKAELSEAKDEVAAWKEKYCQLNQKYSMIANICQKE